MACIYGLITLVDDNVGKVVKAIKEEGLYENTMIIFTCDHGDFSSKYGIIGKSWSMDDCLMRTPLIISHPEHRKASVNESLVENIDILPTILDYTGVRGHDRIQGTSLLPIVKGEKEKVKDAIFANNEFHTEDAHLHQSMIRAGKWKFVQSQNFKGELYNLEDDPNEVFNLVNEEEHKELITELKEKLLYWHVGQSGTFFDTINNSYWEVRTNFYDETKFTGG
ncbi:MAG: sulfatase family protein, partial [Planctomycetota bacterium]|jgi:arylsulfatase A-like enzyme